MDKISFSLNGNSVIFEGDLTTRLIDVLRNTFRLTGVKEGCGEGSCGACVILVDDLAINSCLVPVGNIANKNLVTIEGFRTTKKYEVLFNAFSHFGGSQCGFCTPGMIIASNSLLTHNPHPNELEIKEGLSGNLCRCTGYDSIVKAVLKASKDGEGLW